MEKHDFPQSGAAGSQRRGMALSAREIEVLRLLVQGLSNEQIGRLMTISRHTVANHVRRIIDKVGAPNRTAAAVYAVRHGIA